MRLALLAVGSTFAFAVGVVTEAIFDSRPAGGIAFATLLVALVSLRVARQD